MAQCGLWYHAKQCNWYMWAYRMVVLGYNATMYNLIVCRLTAWYMWDTSSEKMRVPRANKNMQARARANENCAMQVTANKNTVRWCEHWKQTRICQREREQMKIGVPCKSQQMKSSVMMQMRARWEQGSYVLGPLAANSAAVALAYSRIRLWYHWGKKDLQCRQASSEWCRALSVGEWGYSSVLWTLRQCPASCVGLAIWYHRGCMLLSILNWAWKCCSGLLDLSFLARLDRNSSRRCSSLSGQWNAWRHTLEWSIAQCCCQKCECRGA